LPLSSWGRQRHPVCHVRLTAMNFLVLALLAALPHDAGPNPDGGSPLLTPPSLTPLGTVEPPYDPVVESGYDLRISGQGYLYQGLNFDAQISPDGSVSFRDKHGSVGFAPFSWITIPASRREPQLLERTPSEPSIRRSPWLPPSERARPPLRTPEQREICPRDSSCWTPIPMTGSIVAGSVGFDVTEDFMRSLGGHPYAREKAGFLSATFEFRLKLAVDARKQLMKETLDFFPERLQALWADARYSPRERRRIIYELWAQTDTTRAGAQAAEMIDLFVKQHLSCGTPDGYTRPELDALRSRHPERVFAPGACETPAVDGKHRR
jgi:hypothetical protein